MTKREAVHNLTPRKLVVDAKYKTCWGHQLGTTNLVVFKKVTEKGYNLVCENGNNVLKRHVYPAKNSGLFFINKLLLISPI